MKVCDIVEYQKHSTGLKMIQNELKILTTLEEDEEKHPNINRFYMAFHDKYSLYFAFDMKTCGDLRLHLHRLKTTIDEKGVAFIAICLSDALNYLHSRGILHRDIKPENVLMDETGYPYLTDFGVSYIDVQPHRDLMCTLGSGTKEYMSPEVLCKTRIHGAEADFWSLGVMLYEILLRTRPFDYQCPRIFIRFTNYLHNNGVYLTSTGSKYYKSTRKGMKESNTSVEFNSLVDKSTDNSDYPTLVTSSPRSQQRSPDEYIFSKIHHDAYVKEGISKSQKVSNKLIEMKCHAKGERKMRLVDIDECADPGAIEIGLDSDIEDELPSSMRVTVSKPFFHESTPVGKQGMDVVSRLLDPRPWMRLGAGANYSTLQQHNWFIDQGLNWNDVINRKHPSPINTEKSKLDLNEINKVQQMEELYESLQYPSVTRTPNIKLTTSEKRILDNFYYLSPALSSDSSNNAITNSQGGTVSSDIERSAESDLEAVVVIEDKSRAVE